MKLHLLWVAAGFLGWQESAFGGDLPCPSVQLMQIDWLGGEQEALSAGKASLAAAGLKITGSSAFSLIGAVKGQKIQGILFTHPKTPAVTSLAIACIASDPMEALKHAQAVRSQMGKTPSPGREVKGTYTAIWVQEGGDDPASLPPPWFKALSFTWHGAPDAAGVAVDEGLHTLGFKNINGGGINPAHSGINPAKQLTAVVTYAPIDETSARVHVLMAGYGPSADIESLCGNLKNLISSSPENHKTASPAKDTGALAKAVDAVVKKLVQDGRLPGMAVGVLHDNHIVYLHGYGLAQGFDPDHTAKTSVPEVPVTEDTLFRWGSVIKTVTAVTALHLMEEGRLKLGVKVQDYVPSFPVKDNPETHEPIMIDAHELLCHQSGLPHYKDKDFLKAKPGFKLNANDPDPMHSLGAFEDSTLLFKPGSKTHYSSYGYMLLSAVIEKAGGKPFTELVNTSIIQPLGLKTLHIDPLKGLAPPGHAEGYSRDDEGHVVVRHAADLAWKTGAGGYASNVKDLARWAEALLQQKLLTPKTYAMAWKHQPQPTGQPPGLGLGFFLGKDGAGHPVVYHNGLADNATCQLSLYPDDNEGVVIMCNCVPGGKGYAGPDVAGFANTIHDAAHAALAK